MWARPGQAELGQAGPGFARPGWGSKLNGSGGAVPGQAGLRCGLAWVRARIVAYASNYMQATSGLG